MKNKDSWLKDASGNPRKRDFLEAMQRESNQREASKFEASLKNEIPKVRADWALSDSFHGKNQNGELMISRIRFLLPRVISESQGRELVGMFQDGFEKIIYKKKEE